MTGTGGVLVGGGTGALGTAVTAALLDAGYAVTATWRSKDERDRAAATLGERHALTLAEADLTDADATAAVVDAVPDLRAVVNLVGGFAAHGKVHETEPEAFDHLLRLNLRPAFLLARAAMPRLCAAPAGGSFVAVSARTAVSPTTGTAAYGTAKAAVLAFVRALDADYRGSGVRCNALLPGVIDTPGNRAAMPTSDRSRWTSPTAIAQAVRFLVSDESAAVTGAALPVDAPT
jgi:NAD(P)-dependent dehydrogenase (short-subunit alcohol dehydrogenase family)